MAWRAWSSPCSATSTGSTPAASTIRSAASHQPSSKPPTTMNTMNLADYTWTESINRASEKPGEIQPSSSKMVGVLCQPNRKGATMATDHRKVSEQLAQEILLEDPNFLREIVERGLQEMLEAEMSEQIGAAP